MAMARWIIYAVIVLLGKLTVFILAPLLALCVKYYDEDKYPVATRFGIKRPHLLPWLRWAQSFDDALDSYWWWETKSAWLRKHFDQEYYDKHGWLRWYCRVCWLWRNPAYGLTLALGFDQTGLVYTRDDDPDEVQWDNKMGSNKNITLRRRFKNAKGRKGFLYRKRVFYTSKRYIQIVLGWKVPWDGEKNAMLAVRVTPFRSI